MLEQLKRAVRRSLIGDPAQRLYRRLWPRTLAQRDAQYNVETEFVMARVLAPDSVCLDIGAHRGSLLASMVRLAPQGRHWAFEPLPAYAARLRADFPTVTVCEVALSEHAGPVPFHHAVAAPGWSGLARRTVGPLATTAWETLTVAGARLDDLVPSTTPVAFLKIDVEGAEYRVFLGGAQLLHRHRPVIVFEHAHGNAGIYGPKSGQVYDLLQDCGLTVTTMARWLWGRPSLTREQFVAQLDANENFYFMAHRHGLT